MSRYHRYKASLVNAMVVKNKNNYMNANKSCICLSAGLCFWNKNTTSYNQYNHKYLMVRKRRRVATRMRNRKSQPVDAHLKTNSTSSFNTFNVQISPTKSSFSRSTEKTQHHPCLIYHRQHLVQDPKNITDDFNFEN